MNDAPFELRVKSDSEIARTALTRVVALELRVEALERIIAELTGRAALPTLAGSNTA
jgi:hypothetical protein